MGVNNKILRPATLGVALALLCVFATPARAADGDILPDEIVKKKKAKKGKKKKKEKDGWHPKLDAGFNFAFSQS